MVRVDWATSASVATAIRWRSSGVRPPPDCQGRARSGLDPGGGVGQDWSWSSLYAAKKNDPRSQPRRHSLREEGSWKVDQISNALGLGDPLISEPELCSGGSVLVQDIGMGCLTTSE